jgi:hypothetical protein
LRGREKVGTGLPTELIIYNVLTLVMCLLDSLICHGAVIRCEV